jgi:hypothetical protein
MTLEIYATNLGDATLEGKALEPPSLLTDKESRHYSDFALQISESGVRSSIFMSLNSLESKTSPHSLHSTNSDSSSRPTICTRGCLQAGFLSGVGGAGDLDVIIREGSRQIRADGCVCREFPVF